ncbi:hypothetical protein EPA93_29425 [Ktedonosporobacter rubrisoli]|uniref:Uncharacterized protein n=1 Tax=Ktedonosporobacter rubrisoli TaxID=2509675 RepID=A0A4P6JW21_KTERU|nr:hypothetical protein [Ktedonosporobacter rubrisoli]QBD79879.1 hypothetical protein EPA93_29425 [Ktedonosporobacter rubrisoli]
MDVETHTIPEPFEIVTLPHLRQQAASVLIEHGCSILELPERCIITLPAGTTRQEIIPRTRCQRYRLTLPDGYQLTQICPRRETEFSDLYLNAPALDGQT